MKLLAIMSCVIWPRFGANSIFILSVATIRDTENKANPFKTHLRGSTMN
jgi:hypothetical protein